MKIDRSKYRSVDDSQVLMVFEPTCDCDVEPQECHPWDLADVGLPICPECGDDMELVDLLYAEDEGE